MRTLTFKFPNGKEYTLEVKEDDDQYWWEEGNASCDCNRLLILARKYPELDQDPNPSCGETIDLIKVDPPWKEDERNL